MSRQTTMPTEGDTDLYTEAELAATGDDSALDRLFAALGGAAWGLGFAAADAVGPATDAVAKGFAELLQLFDNGLSVGDVRTELLRATRAAALESVKEEEDGEPFEGAHAREPLTLLGETKDRQATLAFTALSEPMRSSLWLTEAEGFSITKTAQLLGETHKGTEDIVRQARANFRGYYVDAVKRDGLSVTCTTTLDKLAAYVGRSLPAGEVAAVEHHLAECKDCRAIVMKLDDLEGRLRAAIPSLPAWTRQQVADTWATYVPIATTAVTREPKDTDAKKKPVGALIGFVAVIAAFVIVLLGFGAFGSSSSSSSKSKTVAVATTAAPTTAKAKTTTTVVDNNAVATPTVPTTVAPPVPTTVVPSTAVAPVPTTSAPTTQVPRRVVTTTTAAPKPTTTTADPYSLVNLPPTPLTH